MTTFGAILFIAGQLLAVGWMTARSWRGFVPTRSEFVLVFAALLLMGGTLLGCRC